MLLDETGLGTNLMWKLERHDPTIIDVSDEFAVLNPLAYARIGNENITSEKLCWAVVNGRAIVETNRIIVLWKNERPSAGDSFTLLSDFLENLRYCSKQATLPQRVTMMRSFELEELPEAQFPANAIEVQGRLRKYLVDWAIGVSALQCAGSLLGNKPPIFHSLMLDAVHALYQGDYRRTLLYAAMSIETLAGASLDTAYEERLANGIHPSLRIAEFPLPGGAIRKKDPVFTYLRHDAKLAQMLHEIPLYLLGRSLLLSDEPRYQQAIKLYRTRNRLAHTGIIPEGDEYYPAEPSGGFSGVRAALAVFEWFGTDWKYPYVVDDGIISFELPVFEQR